MLSGKPIVIAYHLIWTLYGWWLPNDPRGSGSKTIASDIFAELGELHHGRKRIQPPRKIIHGFCEQAASRLNHPLLTFQPAQFESVARAISDAISQCAYTCYACAVMPDHIHLLIQKHRDSAETMIENLQTLSRKRLNDSNIRHPNHPTWTRGGWKVFLDHPDDIRRTITYINRNPQQQNLPLQNWHFITPYDNWPLHVGHNSDSPYARALRTASRYPH
jgi:REP-associated tyrosine transposase